jgi:hypothetical protein
LQVSNKLKKSLETNPDIIAAVKNGNRETNWNKFTRTHFNLIARIINKKISREVLRNPDLVEMNLITGKQHLEKQLFTLKCQTIFDFLRYLGNLGEYRVYNWISGKTLQSYWNEGEAKYIKINVLLVFLEIPFVDWNAWQKENGRTAEPYATSLGRNQFSSNGYGRSSLMLIKSYYLGNYFLYYQKTDGSKNIIKTPFVLKENESGQIIVKSVSEGHRYMGKVMGIRDGCLYINCQNLDFEEMEQYVFNIGLETKPQVLFGVSNTVSVKNRQAVALKNILIKQSHNDTSFDNIPETEIPFSNKYSAESEESIVVRYLAHSGPNIIVTPSCCNMEVLGELAEKESLL